MRTRLAPSPTGVLHLGNARTFLLTWLHARSTGASIVLRVDDLDGPRIKAGAEQSAIEDLRFLGLDWDDDEPVLRQSERVAVYAAALDDLLARGLAYACVCTRREVQEAASAPHAGSEGPVYPGTCDGRFTGLADAAEQSGRTPALRFRVPERDVTFEDVVYGPRAHRVDRETGDFPIRRADATAAYQLATVLDDHESGVDLVIRGSDLLPSTARQILLQEALGLPRPTYLHLPLVVGPDGRRLAKRHGDTSLATLRRQGWDEPALVGWLAATAGLAKPGERVTARALIERYDPAGIGREAVGCDVAHLAPPT